MGRTFTVTDRPFALTVAFWLSIAATLGFSAYAYRQVPTLPFGFPVVAPLVVGTVGSWLLMPWDARTTGRRKLFSPLFLLFATAVVTFDGTGLGAPLMMVALANILIMFGMRSAIALALLAIAPMYLVALPLFYHRSPSDLFFQALQLTLISTFVFGIAAAVVKARELLAQLESAHAELARYADRVRELTVARERARMAREMHDSVGHHLTVITVGLRNAERFRKKRPESAWDEVRQARELTEDALAETRRWVRALRPLALDGAVGSAALEALAKSFEGTGISVRLEVEGPERPLDSDVELVLYRVLQEGLVNAVRHGNAGKAVARLVFGADNVMLEVGDDGTGAAARTDEGFGLSSLSERARAVGGTLTTENGREGGFVLRADLPCRPSAY
ncbi:sensor histidine kinase [Fodinicola acaciae]|uniref:sensor histidine kinase n=1 Tax=Fodinicola acaciae TaxID=2681555 RepID=UPI0013D3B9EE|nr:sensor histidine kinase [Fodinicola acaciae]